MSEILPITIPKVLTGLTLISVISLVVEQTFHILHLYLKWRSESNDGVRAK